MSNPDNLRDRPVFICASQGRHQPAAGRFDSHPQLIVYPEETVFFRRYLPRAAGLDLESQLALADETLIHIFKWRREHPVPSQAGFPDRDYSAIPYDQVRQTMRNLAGERCLHPGDLLSAAVLAYGQVSGLATPATRLWVEKSPYNEYYAAQIFAWWPEARCIHILRDPRDNYVSYRRKHPEWQPEFFALNWRRSTAAGEPAALWTVTHPAPRGSGPLSGGTRQQPTCTSIGIHPWGADPPAQWAGN
jgi:hypothetical protein